MLAEHRLVGKRLVALAAGVGPLLGVRAHVPVEIAARLERNPADFTREHVWFVCFDAVCVFVHKKVFSCTVAPIFFFLAFFFLNWLGCFGFEEEINLVCFNFSYTEFQKTPNPPCVKKKKRTGAQCFV